MTGWKGYALAVAAVGLALLARLGLEAFGRFYYLPLIPAVMLPAMLASRRATMLAIALSILANVILVPREGLVDAAVNATLFAIVGLAIGEIGRARRAALTRSATLSDQLDRREATIDALLASAPVMVVGQDDRILAASPRGGALFGHTPQSITGLPVQHFIERFDRGVLHSDTPPPNGVIHTWQGRRNDGSTFPIGARGAMTNGDADDSELVLVMTDISVWHLAEARSKELSDQLSKVWRLNSLGEMAAMLSHELNQPLTAAATYMHGARSDMLLAGFVGEAAVRNIDLAKGQVLRAGAIIRRARQLLAVDGDSLHDERVSSMMEDLQPILSLLGPASGVELEFDIDAMHDEVLADRIQFQQAVVNLVRNAVEAAERSDTPGRVRLSGHPVSAEAFEIRVEDNGPGVEAEQMTAMFRPLISTKKDGMGLGLSVTRSIVERHGGLLRIERSDLGGAAFVFELKRSATEHWILAA